MTGDLDDENIIARRYLHIQVRKIVNSLEKLAAAGSFAAEEPKGAHLIYKTIIVDVDIPRTENPADEHGEVIAEALRILRRLKNDHEKLSIQEGALDMLLLSRFLDDLEMWEDAEITCIWAANLYRTLLQGNHNVFLSHLATCLLNLTAIRTSLCDDRGSLTASEEVIEVLRKLQEMGHPDSAELFALALGNHSQSLISAHYLTEGLTAAEESVENFRKLVKQEEELHLRVLYNELEHPCATISDPDSQPEAPTVRNNAKMQIVNDTWEMVGTRAGVSRFARLKFGLGKALGSLSDSLADNGQATQAYNASKESLDIFRSISEVYPCTFNVIIARGLYRASFCLSTLDRPLEALPLIEEATKIYRDYALKARTASWVTQLISSLCHLAALLRKVGRNDDALIAGNEAISVYRSLPSDHPNFTLCLSRALTNIDSQLRVLGRDEEALALSTEAVDMYRTSISDSPSLLPSFAKALIHLADRLHSADRLKDALVIRKEAVDVYRPLAKAEPAVYSPHLASGLADLAESCYSNGEYEEAIVAGDEVVNLYHNFGEGHPDLDPSFVAALHTLRRALRNAKRRENTIAIGIELISVYRSRANNHLDEYPRNLVEALMLHARDLRRNGQYHDGIVASQEAFKLCHSFESPDKHAAIEVVCSLALGVINVGRVEEGILLCQETVAIYRKLMGTSPDIAEQIQDLLILLSEVYRTKGQLEEAVAVSEEAVSLCRDMLPENPLDLVYALDELSASHMIAGNLKDALRESEEAVEVSRKSPSSDYASFLLAYSLNRLSNCLAKYGREKDAFSAAQEAIDLYQKFCPRHMRRQRCFDFDVEIAEALYDFAALLAATGRPADALENIRESSNIYRKIVTTQPFHLPKFAVVLRSLSFQLSGAGRKAESLDVENEELMVREYVVSEYPDLVPALQYALGQDDAVLMAREF